MQHMETTEHELLELTERMNAIIDTMKADLELQESIANSWRELYEISFKNTNMAMEIVEYWKGKYHAQLEAK